jgi:formate dehydrogenase maturation protein FdhE
MGEYDWIETKKKCPNCKNPIKMRFLPKSKFEKDQMIAVECDKCSYKQVRLYIEQPHKMVGAN